MTRHSTGPRARSLRIVTTAEGGESPHERQKFVGRRNVGRNFFRYFWKRLGVLLLAVLLSMQSGCLILGRRQTDKPLKPEQVSKVQPGMTKHQVTDLLGAPNEIIFSNKEHDPLREHAYVYEYRKDAGTMIFFAVVNFANLDTKRDRVLVFFDEAGKVQNVGASLYGEDASYGFPFGK